MILLLSITVVACKTSKDIQSTYQPPVVSTQTDSTSDVERAKNTAITQKPIIMRTEGITFYNPNDENGGYYDYYVIIGSFSLASNATNLSDQLIIKGFDSIILKSESGNYRVAVKGTNDKQEAQDLVYRIRAISPEYSDAWLLRRK